MRRQIKKHASVFVAILLMLVLALGVGGYILSNQRFYLPAWVPLVGTDFYEVEAELQTGQAVVPGQGQTVNIAGVKVGEVGEVNLEDGRAVVQMQIKDEYKPIYKDATILLRPKTGLKDMYLSLDPGTEQAGEIPEGGRVAVYNTLPDINADEVLAQLDDDTRAYLRVLLNAGGTAFDDEATGAAATYDQTAAQDLRETFKRFEPIARDGKRITSLLIQRRRNIARVVHNFQEFSTALAGRDRELAALVDSANANFEAFAVGGGRVARGAAALPRRRSTRPSRRSRRPARWPPSSARRSRDCARSRATWRLRCARRSRSSARPRRSSATRSGRSRATSSRLCATCAARARAWQS